MPRRFVKMPSFANVAAGNSTSLTMPVGLTYDALHIQYAGVTLAELQNITLKINGKAVQEYVDGVMLQDMNKHYQRNIKSGVLSIYFARPEFEKLEEGRAFALGTQGLDTVSLEIDIAGTATSPALTAFAIQSPPKPLVLLTKVKRFPVSFSTAGQHEIDKLPKPAGAQIAAIHAFSANVDKLELEVDSYKVYDFDKTLGAGIQADYGRDPQTAKATVVDMTLEGDPRQALTLAGVQDLRIRPTMGSAGAVDVVVEYFDRLAGI